MPVEVTFRPGESRGSAYLVIALDAVTADHGASRPGNESQQRAALVQLKFLGSVH